MSTRNTDTPPRNRSEEPKRFDFHEFCVKLAITVSITVGALKFIWTEVEGVIKAVLAWIS